MFDWILLMFCLILHIGDNIERIHCRCMALQPPSLEMLVLTTSVAGCHCKSCVLHVGNWYWSIWWSKSKWSMIQGLLFKHFHLTSIPTFCCKSNERYVTSFGNVNRNEATPWLWIQGPGESHSTSHLDRDGPRCLKFETLSYQGVKLQFFECQFARWNFPGKEPLMATRSLGSWISRRL